MPEGLTRRHTVVPLKFDGTTLLVAAANNPSNEVRALLEQASERPVDFVLAPNSDIRWAIDSSYRAIGGVDRLVQAFEEVESTRRREVDTTAAEAADDTAPVVQVVSRILTQAKRDRASDVHIEPSQDVVRIRFRIDGALKEVLMLPASIGVGLVSRIKIMAGMNIVERRRPQDGQLTTEIDGMSTDVRVATASTIWGEKCVLRILDRNRSVLRLGDLGMPADTHETFSRLTGRPRDGAASGAAESPGRRCVSGRRCVRDGGIPGTAESPGRRCVQDGGIPGTPRSPGRRNPRDGDPRDGAASRTPTRSASKPGL